MGKSKVRCGSCGAKNGESSVDRCRICSALLPDAEQRRELKTTSCESFTVSVEHEVGAWRDYEEGRLDTAARSRRPAELPPVFTQTAVPGQALASAPAPPPPAPPADAVVSGPSDD